jgi:hypothetical protein
MGTAAIRAFCTSSKLARPLSEDQVIV